MADLDAAARRFLDRHITSVMQLEVLLALRGSAQPMTTRQLTRRLGGSVDQALQCIADLERSGLVEQLDEGNEVAARYIGSGDVDAEVEVVGAEYGLRKARVIAFVLRDRSRDALEDFSDAFRLRRDR